MKLKEFNYSMPRRSLMALSIYLPIHAIVLPLLVEWHASLYPGAFSALQYNTAYIAFSFVCVVILGLKYLRSEFDTLMDNKLFSLFTLIQGYFLYICLNYLLLLALIFITGGIEWTNPNNEAVAGMAADDMRKVLAMTVFLGPIVEETLFRGVIFGALRRRDKLAAYIVSMALFAILHVWQYIFAFQDLSVLIYALDYLPAGFILAWCYDRTGSLWPSIIFHMGINLSALSLVL